MDIHVYCSINHSSHAMEPVQMSSVGRWIKAVSWEHSAKLSQFWRTLVIRRCTEKKMDRTGGYYVKRNKPDSHRPTPHAFLLCRIHFQMCVHVFIWVFTCVNRTCMISGSCVGKEGIKKGGRPEWWENQDDCQLSKFFSKLNTDLKPINHLPIYNLSISWKAELIFVVWRCACAIFK